MNFASKSLISKSSNSNKFIGISFVLHFKMLFLGHLYLITYFLLAEHKNDTETNLFNKQLHWHFFTSYFHL